MIKEIYHATSPENCKKIMANGFIFPRVNWQYFYSQSGKHPGSLGFGVYGFLNDRMLAQKFYKKDDVPGILKITLELDPDYELNFVDNLEDMMLFRAFLQEQEIHKTLDYIRRNYQNKFTQHELDGALIEYYIRELKRHGDALINDVCCATTTAIYKNIKTYIPNGVEYCLRNDETIKTIEVE